MAINKAENLEEFWRAGSWELGAGSWEFIVTSAIHPLTSPLPPTITFRSSSELWHLRQKIGRKCDAFCDGISANFATICDDFCDDLRRVAKVTALIIISTGSPTKDKINNHPPPSIIIIHCSSDSLLPYG
jgi:hypothetical protein